MMHTNEELSQLWDSSWEKIKEQLLTGFSLAEFLAEDEEDGEVNWLSSLSLNMDAVKPFAEKNATVNPLYGFVLTSELMTLPLDDRTAVYVGHLHADHDLCTHPANLCPSHMWLWESEEIGIEATVEMVHVIATSTRILFYLHHACDFCDEVANDGDVQGFDYTSYLMDVLLKL